MARVLAVANQKGGVSKTTTAVQVAGYLAAAGHRTLLVDLDPQGNATLAVGKGPADFDLSALDLFRTPELSAAQVIIPAWPKLDLLPCDIRLSVLDLEAAAEGRRIPLGLIRERLNQVQDRYAWVVIDTPPSLGAFTLNALAAADRVLVPVDGANAFGAVGFKLLLQTVDLVRRGERGMPANHQLRVLGYFRARWDDRLILARETWAAMVESWPRLALETAIPVNVRLPEAMAVGQHIYEYEARATGAHAYLNLVGEILDRWEATGW